MDLPQLSRYRPCATANSTPPANGMMIKSKLKDAAWLDSVIGHTEGLITVQYIAIHGLRLRLVPIDAANVMAS